MNYRGGPKKKRFYLPEEYNEAICLKNHSQNWPSDNNKEEANTKRDSSLHSERSTSSIEKGAIVEHHTCTEHENKSNLIILTFHKELHGRLQTNSKRHPCNEENLKGNKESRW